MSAPRRLLSDERTPDHVRELLADWVKNEQPSADARARTLSALGIAAGASALGAGASLAPKAAGSALLGTKWASIGAVVIAASAGTYAYLTSSATPPSATSTAPVATASPQAPQKVVAPAIDVAALPSATAPSATELPGASQVRATPHRPAPSAAAAAASTDALAHELALVDDARGALDHDDAARALKLLDDYASRFPNGTFAQEAAVLRVDALVRRGDRATATALAQRFLAQYPRSPHAPRLRALLASTP